MLLFYLKNERYDSNLRSKKIFEFCLFYEVVVLVF